MPKPLCHLLGEKVSHPMFTLSRNLGRITPRKNDTVPRLCAQVQRSNNNARTSPYFVTLRYVHLANGKTTLKIQNPITIVITYEGIDK